MFHCIHLSMSRSIELIAMSQSNNSISYNPSEIAFNAGINLNDDHEPFNYIDPFDHSEDHPVWLDYGFNSQEDMDQAELEHIYKMEMREIMDDMDQNPYLYHHQDDLNSNHPDRHDDDLPF